MSSFPGFARLPKVLDLPDIADSPEIPGFRLGTTVRPIQTTPIQPQDIPSWYRAAFPRSTDIEYLAYWALNEEGLRAVNDPRGGNWSGWDFRVQQSFGTARTAGSTTVDILVDRPNHVALYLNGERFHPLDNHAVTQRFQFLRLGAMGYHPIAIDGDHMHENARYYVHEAVFNLRSFARGGPAGG